MSSLIYVYVCLFLNIYIPMGRETHLAGLASFAVHQVRDGWEILAPSDDPYTPAYWRVAVIRQYDQHAETGLNWSRPRRRLQVRSNALRRSIKAE